MKFKLLLINLDHVFTEKVNHWIEQVRYGRKIDFSIPGETYRNQAVEGYVRYQATVFINHKMMKTLSISKEDSILDIGCGKGKMVFYFSRMGFGRSDGIEYSKELTACAKKNLKLLRIKSDVINIDATKFSGYENYNYFYFYNPFDRETMQCVLEKIQDSYIHKPRKMVIIYCNPLYHTELVKIGFHLKYSDANRYRKLTGRITNIYTNEK